MNTQNTPAPISPLALVERQLTDWQNLHTELKNADEPDATQIAYCKTQIERLLNELATLKTVSTK